MSWRAEIVLIRLWLEVGQQEQERRFEAPIDDPLRQCKLSPVDIEILAALVRPLRSARPDAQSHHSKHALRYIVRSDDKQRAHLNCISHLLEHIPCKHVSGDRVKLTARPKRRRYNGQILLKEMKFVAGRYLCAAQHRFQC